jgi:hypothetical protein
MAKRPHLAWSTIQKNLISIDLDRNRLIVLFAMPTAVALSQCTGVAGWVCPISSSIVLITFPSLQLRKSAPSSASAADTTTHFNTLHKVKMAPFNLMGSPSLGTQPKK